MRIELWRGGAQVADLGTGYDPDGEGVSAITVPPVASAADYKVRVVSAWQPEWFAESPGFVSIQNNNPQSAVRLRDWSLYQ